MNTLDFYNDIERFENLEALILEDSEIVTYSKLVSDADAIREHISEKCLLFNVCDNCLESVAGYVGFLRGGIAQFLINGNTNFELLANLVQIYAPMYIWISKQSAGIFENFSIESSYRNFVLLKSNTPIEYAIHHDLALLLTTSGSTGSPKLVRQAHKNIIANANSIAEYLNISSVDRPITSLPMSYTFGLSVINSHLLQGASILLTNKTIVDKAFWDFLKKEKATTFSGVPYTYEMLKRLAFSKMQLPTIKKLTQAGGRLGPVLSREFAEVCEQKGIEFFVMYGQTEATARMSYLPPKCAISKAGSVGIAIPGGEFWLEDGEGKVITESDKVGELIYRGENVTMGYATSYNDLGKGDENSGILRTGDMAKRDEDGFYYVVGRNKRFLKLFGNRINLDEVEQMLSVKGFSCVCAGEDDNLRIYTTEREKLNDIRSYVADHTGINASGFSVLYIEEIPRNQYGRIKYSLLS